MRFLFLLLFFGVVFTCLGQERRQLSFVDRDLVMAASDLAREDGVGRGWCGRGTWSVLKALGLSTGLQSADGHDWEGGLWAAGWRPFGCLVPEDAPYGSVLVYTSDFKRVGRNLRGTGGGRWGHVEMVAWDSRLGGRVYVSDAARLNPGGTVLDNFTGRAWAPPSFVALYMKVRGHLPPFCGYVGGSLVTRPVVSPSIHLVTTLDVEAGARVRELLAFRLADAKRAFEKPVTTLTLLR